MDILKILIIFGVTIVALFTALDSWHSYTERRAIMEQDTRIMERMQEIATDARARPDPFTGADGRKLCRAFCDVMIELGMTPEQVDHIKAGFPEACAE